MNNLLENIKTKRIMAYLIDILLISVICTLLGNINFLNPKEKEYKETINNYNEYYDSNIANVTNMSTEKLLTPEYIGIMHDLNNYGLSHTIIEVLVMILYFTLFPLFYNGQTIGKKLLKIKIKFRNNKYKFLKLLLRSLFMPIIVSIIIYCPLTNIGNVIITIFFTGNRFIKYTTFLSGLFCGFCYVDILSGLIKKDGRTLHDRFSKTDVVLLEIIKDSKTEKRGDK